MNELMQPPTDGNTIDILIKTVNQLYKDIQLQDAYQDTDEGVKEDTTQEDKIIITSSKSFGGGEIVEETTSEPPTTGGSEGTVLSKTVSAPIQNLPPPVNQIRKLQVTLRRLKRNLKYMKILQLDVNTEMKKQLHSLKDMSSTNLIENDLEVITKNFLGMIRKVPVQLVKQKEKKASLEYQDGDGGNNRRPIVCLPAIHANEEELKRLAVFRDVRHEFEKLSDTPHLQICLLSFAVFPENQEVNRTMLMYWWIGEGILPDEFTQPEDGFRGSYKVNPEEVVKKILKEFTVKKLIEPVENKRKVEPSSYKMTPFVHSSVVLISKEIGLFDMYPEGKKPTMRKSDLKKVCLVEESSSQPEAKGRIMKPENIETVFNVSERFPEFTGKWFTSMKKLKVLYLGRWERTEREIEMYSRRVMKDLSSLGKLRFLSFQGISTIRSLSRSACKLTELIILDLRDCYNLEKLPDDIKKLRNLVYLDLTGCEALESIPAQLARLENLEVLKGFVLSDNETAITCKLADLKHLKKLRKLSITVDREHFGLNDLIEAIEDFRWLENLKVRWGSRIPLSMKKQLMVAEGGAVQRFLMRTQTFTYSKNVVYLPKQALPQQLRKLDLQRFPDSKLPDWLQPQNLKYLEKLHLRSSTRLKGFGDLPKKPTDCCVKVLRLTCLPKLKVEWRELKELYFPKLTFLESYECPRVTFCPCDRDGIWRSDE